MPLSGAMMFPFPETNAGALDKKMIPALIVNS
jgi:hypothetical protein